MDNKKMLMTIGLPFSGKSELAKEYEKMGWEIIRRDTLLETIIHGKEFEKRVEKTTNTLKPSDDQSRFAVRNKVAIEMLTEAVSEIVQRSKSEYFFYDGTNLQRSSRAGILRLQDKGLEVSGIYLKASIDEIQRRMEKSLERGECEEQFNEKAFVEINKMVDLFEEPSEDEGLVELKIYNADAHESLNELKHPR